MGNITIVGAGPIGLYLAIRLAQIVEQNNLNVKINVVDPRAGKYDRPGVVANMALKIISENIKTPLESIREGDDTGTSMFIQDLETALYMIAKKKNIKFIRAEVQDYGKSKIKLRMPDPDAKQIEIVSDIAIDCSGSKRILIKKANEKLPGKHFDISRISDNPIKSHFIAYINADHKNASLLHEKKPKDPIKYALTMEQLRSEFDWQEFIEPELTLRSYTPPDREKTRFYLYFEIPPSLMHASKDKQINWLKALLKLKTENDNIEFEIEPGKMTFIPFLVDPHKVEPPILDDKENSMMILAAGDAQIEPDYRIGIGIWSGINRANALLDSFEIGDQHTILINPAKYEAFLQNPFGKHESELKKDYQLKKEALYNALILEKERYTLALNKVVSHGDKEILKAGLDEINLRLALKWYSNGIQEYQKATDQKGSILLEPKTSVVKEVGALNNCRKLFIQALQNIPPSKLGDRKKTQGTLLTLAFSYKELASKLFAKQRFAESYKYYDSALQIFLTYFSHSHLKEIAIIYSNISIIANKRNQSDLAIKFANYALNLVSTIPDMDNSEKLIIKIKFNKCLAMLKNIDTSLGKKDGEKTIEVQFEQAKILYEEIIDHLSAEPITLKSLSYQFESTREKFMINREKLPGLKLT